MALQLYAHPFSAYCQKVTIALYDSGIPFELMMLAPEAPDNGAAFARLWPLRKMPLLVDGGRAVMESSVILEHLALSHPQAAWLIPSDAQAALDVRFMDRFFDCYVMTPMQRIVADFMRPPGQRDALTVQEAKALLDRAYAWLDNRMAGGEGTAGWACESGFGMADCAAAPALFYADWVHPIPESLPAARRYRARLLAHPSVARAVDEARPYRPLFPPGAPDRD